jgi:hypothetical protein
MRRSTGVGQRHSRAAHWRVGGSFGLFGLILLMPYEHPMPRPPSGNPHEGNYDCFDPF